MIKDLLTIIPNAEYYKRGTYDLKKVRTEGSYSLYLSTLILLELFCSKVFVDYFQIVDYANNKEYTSVIVVHTSRREPGHFSSGFHSLNRD